MADGGGGTALKVQCGTCQIVVNVPISLVAPLIEVSQFKCPKCGNLQSISMSPDAKKQLMLKVELWSQATGQSDARSQMFSHLYSGGGPRSAAMMDMVKRAQDSGAQQGGSRASFNQMVHTMVEDADEEADDHDSGATFASYMPKKLDYGGPHPDPIVESASMAAVETPDVTYTPAIRDIGDQGLLSAPQLESIVYACMRHEQTLPNGSRAGFFLADSAGLGKGRTLAGLVLENWRRGRKRHIWVSVGSDLSLDAERDLRDILADDVPVFPLNKVPYGPAAAMARAIPEGVIFLTYSGLVAMNDRKQSRMDQLLEWCGDGFDGLLLFDECHKAKNLMPQTGSTPTRTGLNVQLLQERLPRARIVYCSATGASSPRSMAYMVRLALWGPKNVFTDFKDFLAAVESKGLGTLQIVAMEMKARGMYLARSLSYEGAEFELITVPLPTDIRAMYHLACDLWTAVRTQFMDALEALEEHGFPAPRSVWRQYWATHQRFFRHMCLAAKVPRLVELSKAALADGMSVCVGLQSTGEARTSDVVAEKGAVLMDFVSGPRELLIKLVQDCFPLPEGKDQASAEAPVALSDDEPADIALEHPDSGPADSAHLATPRKPGTKASGPRSAPRSAPKSPSPCQPSPRRPSSVPSGGPPLPNPTATGIAATFARSRSLRGNVSDPGAAAAAAACGSANGSASGCEHDAVGGHARLCEPPAAAGACKRSAPEDCDPAHRDGLRESHKRCRVHPDCDMPHASASAECPAGASSAGPASLHAHPDSQWAAPCGDKGPEPPKRLPPDVLAKLLAEKKQLLDCIRAMQLPPNPLDSIIDLLGGPNCVAEMTGRKARLVRQGSKVVYENRNASGAPGTTLEMINVTEKQLFLDGQKRVAIISEAASAGISLHAERRQKNQQRRMHITLEMPWSAERVIQQFGRSHRANQSSAPLYKLLFTELGGEMRFAAAVAKRLLSMGALTQGDQRACSSGLASSDLHYDSPWGKAALQNLYGSLLQERACPLPEHEIPACTPSDAPPAFSGMQTFFAAVRACLLQAGVFKPRAAAACGAALRLAAESKACSAEDVRMDDTLRGDVPRFLNRLLGVEPDMQRHVFDFFQVLVQQAVRRMKREGTYDTGIVELQATTIEHAHPAESVCRDPVSGAATFHHTLLVDRGLPFATVLATHRRVASAGGDEAAADSGVGFWMSKGQGGSRSILFAQLIPQSSPPMMRVQRPKIGKSCRNMALSELRVKMQPVLDTDVARSAWEKLYKAASKLGSARVRHVHLITGSILPYWKILSDHLAQCPHKVDRRLKVIRVVTTADVTQTLVGVVIPDGRLESLLQDIQAENQLARDADGTGCA